MSGFLFNPGKLKATPPPVSTLGDLEIIAEIGSNWRDLKAGSDYSGRLLRHIGAAKQAGATIAKLQIFTANTLYSQERAPELRERARPYEMPISLIAEARTHANHCRIKLWASIFSPRLVRPVAPYLHGLKVASGDLTNVPLLEEMARASRECRIPLGISTGAATAEEIATALDIVSRQEPLQIALFYCVSAYPAALEAINLRGGTIFRKRVTTIGFSDHTLGSEAAKLAYAMGYTIFEKHFKDWGVKDTDSPDAPVSLNPDQFREYVSEIRWAAKIVGIPVKKVDQSEVNERIWARRGSDGLRPATE